jgi:hypothetical protein
VAFIKKDSHTTITAQSFTFSYSHILYRPYSISYALIAKLFFPIALFWIEKYTTAIPANSTIVFFMIALLAIKFVNWCVNTARKAVSL